MTSQDHASSVPLVVASDHDDDPVDVDYSELLGTDRLPPLRLPSPAELVDAARDSPLLTAVRVLAQWVGEGRPVDEDTAQLSEADAAAAARKLVERGLLPPSDDDARMRELMQLWELADALGFVEVVDTTAVAGAAVDEWAEGDEDTVLGMWAQAFTSLCAWSLTFDAACLGVPELPLHGAGATVLPLFMAREKGVPLAALDEMVHETAALDGSESEDASFEEAWRVWVDAYGRPARVLYERLRWLGAVTIADELVRLTPLGLFALWSEIEQEVDIPLLPPLEEMTAADVVAVTLLGSDEQVEAEWDAWRSRRTATQAAAELAAAASVGGPGERTAATTLLHRLGAEVDDVWWTLLDEPSLRPYAKRVLSERHGDKPEFALTDDDVAWLIADMYCDVDVDDPPEGIGDLLASTMRRGEERVFDVLWRLEHPGTWEVLSVFGRHHPDKAVAKAARKAAFKVESLR
ncbi:MAG: hypothetical protein ACOX8C_03685 [Saccharomonospora viridis]|jgi:hypothetical protein|uniref:hypothetical protein n=1 Tax=Saccharomonospora viridis TaxID=1852 RepID=UPI003D94C2D7